MSPFIRADLRRRVERLIAGERSTHGLTRLFLGLRDPIFVQEEIVRDVADFIAHQGLRNRGKTTNRATLWWRFLGVFGSANLSELPAREADALEAAFFLHDEAHIAAETGLSPSVARSVLGACKKKIATQQALLPREDTLVRFLRNGVVFQPVITSDALIDSVTQALSTNGLLDALETQPLRAASPYISRFAASIMHGCELALGGGGAALLTLKREDELRPTIDCVIAPIPSQPSSTIRFAFFAAEAGDPPIFATRMLEAEDWSRPVELNGDGLIDFV